MVSAQCEKFTRSKSQHQKYPDNQPIAVAEIKQNNRNLIRCQVDTGDLLARAGDDQSGGCVLNDELELDGFIQDEGARFQLRFNV